MEYIICVKGLKILDIKVICKEVPERHFSLARKYYK